MAAIIVIAAAGYWWLSRPPERFKPDNGGLYPIKVDGKYGFMDRSGKTVIAPQFEQAFEFSEGLAEVRVGAKSGFINTKGVIVITPQFDNVGWFRYGRAAVKLCCGQSWQAKQGDSYGFIDKEGKFISNPSFTWAGWFYSGEFAPVRSADGTVAFVNRAGKIVISGNFDTITSAGFTAGLAPVASGGKWGFLDTNGKWAIDPQFEGTGNFADGLAPVIVGGRTGYIDQKGRFVVNPRYDFGDEFYEGYARFANGGKSGFIDTKGRVLVEAKFFAAGHFSEGLAPVRTDDGWGFIDRAGKIAISPQFDSADGFQNGLARVTVAAKEAYVTTAGAFVVDPSPGRAGIPTHPVQEFWQDRASERFMLIRDGPQIRGYHTVWFGRDCEVVSLKGQAARDGSFSLSDEVGNAWTGKFVSSLLIEGVQVTPKEANGTQLRLRLVRDAAANEQEPLPPTNSDWNLFLSGFKDAVRLRDVAVLSGMVARTGFERADEHLFRIDVGAARRRTAAEALATVKWNAVDHALSQGVETSRSTPRGTAIRSIVDEQPCPFCRYQTLLCFIQEGDKQWRWSGISISGD